MFWMQHCFPCFPNKMGFCPMHCPFNNCHTVVGAGSSDGYIVSSIRWMDTFFFFKLQRNKHRKQVNVAIFWVLFHFCNTHLLHSTDFVSTLVPRCVNFRSRTRTSKLIVRRDCLKSPSISSESVMYQALCQVLCNMCAMNAMVIGVYRKVPLDMPLQKDLFKDNKSLLYLSVLGFMDMILDYHSSLITCMYL